MVVENKILRFKKLTQAAFAPVRGSEKAAGLDLKRCVSFLDPAFCAKSNQILFFGFQRYYLKVIINITSLCWLDNAKDKNKIMF